MKDNYCHTYFDLFSGSLVASLSFALIFLRETIRLFSMVTCSSTHSLPAHPVEVICFHSLIQLLYFVSFVVSFAIELDVSFLYQYFSEKRNNLDKCISIHINRTRKGLFKSSKFFVLTFIYIYIKCMSKCTCDGIYIMF